MNSPQSDGTHFNLKTIFKKIWNYVSNQQVQRILPDGVIIVTTLNPKNPDRQAKALENWRQLNAPVIALNVESEQQDLLCHYPWIQFEIPSKTADHVVGKPFVLFDAFLDWFSSHQQYSHIVILNSDISMPIQPEFWDSAVNLANESLVFGNRLDVDFQNSGTDKIFNVGFDFFILSRNLISCYPASEFCLGAPWWDYWVPFVPLSQGIPCVHAKGTFAKHQWHETQWDIALYFHYCREFISHAKRLGLEFEIPAEVLSNGQITCKKFAHRTSKATLELIYQKSQAVTLNQT